METIITEENIQRNSHVVDPVVVVAYDGKEEEITHLRKDEHIRIQESIWRGNLKLHELEKDQVQLRKTSLLMNAEIKRLEIEITQACIKPRMTRKDTDDHTTTLEECRQEFMILMPWL